jgi:hypothetical protein
MLDSHENKEDGGLTRDDQNAYDQGDEVLKALFPDCFVFREPVSTCSPLDG